MRGRSCNNDENYISLLAIIVDFFCFELLLLMMILLNEKIIIIKLNRIN